MDNSMPDSSSLEGSDQHQLQQLGNEQESFVSEEEGDDAAAASSLMVPAGPPPTAAAASLPESSTAADGNSNGNNNNNIVTPNTELLIAKELLKLNMTEREKAFFDIHGVAEDQDTNQKEEANLAAKLQELDQILAQEEQQNEVYRVAVLQNRDYVTSRAFRLSFLRSEGYNVQEAKARIMRHLELKMRLLGVENLGLHLKMSDLDGEAFQCLQCGIGQTSPAWKDRSGRHVFAWHTPLRFNFSLKSRVST
jgi:hypothetical protein